MRKRLIGVILTITLLSSLLCGYKTKDDKEDILDKQVETVVSQMTLEEKVGQLYIVRPEQMGTIPVGGICIFDKNIKGKDALTKLISKSQASSRIPLFISVDEEGGRVARLANNKYLDIKNLPAMRDIGTSNKLELAYNSGMYIGNYLAAYGINTDFAPVADINSNPLNQVVGDRAFSNDPHVVSDMVGSVIDGLHSQNIVTCMKHFPGHGDTKTDTHVGTALVEKSWEKLMECEIVPYINNINKTDMIMIAHIMCPNVTGDGLPASLSKEMITGKLRGELKYDGIVITDSMEMGAITKIYSVTEATYLAIIAGVDIILMPKDIVESYNALLAMVRMGMVSEARIDESVKRIIKLKIEKGIMKI